jgi:subtilisin family serine protease
MANRAQPFNALALQHLGVPPLESGIDGRGIVLGFVDYGFDFLHPCLRKPMSGSTRFQYIWDQNTGSKFDATAINRLIAEAERTGSRQAADGAHNPHANYFGQHGVQAGAHGTVISSIAAGSPVVGYRGVAPAAELIGVQLGLLDHHWKEEDADGVPTWTSWQPNVQPVWNGWRSYDDATQIISALDYIYDRASHLGARALVINLSIGAYAGAHDGCSAVERKITEIVDRSRRGNGFPCAVVASAGNAGAEDGHFSGEADPARPLTFAWRMQRGDLTQNKLEIWYCSATPLEISISHPTRSGAEIALTISPGRTHAIEAADVRIGIADHVPLARAPLSRVRILLHPPYVPEHCWPTDSGELTFELRCAVTSRERVPVHAWIERDDGLANRSSLCPSHPAATLSNIAAAEGAIIVAGHDHHGGNSPAILPTSSLGPVPWPPTDSVHAPLVSAPAHRIWGARSKSSGFVETSGTSVAAALTSGVVALLMQRLGGSRSFDPRQWAELLVAPDRRHSWSPRFGCGAVNVAHILGPHILGELTA